MPCRRRRRRLARRAKELLRQRSSADDETWLGVNHVKEHALNLFNGDPDDEVNRMGSMDDNVEDKQSQIQPIEIKINLVNKQVMSMD